MVGHLQSGLRVCDVAEFSELSLIYQTVASSIQEEAFFNWTAESAMDELSKAETLLFSENNQIASFVTYRKYDDRLEISAIACNPAFKGQGFAKRVLLGLIANAAQRAVSIWLEVHEKNNSALQLYLRCGFQIIQTRKRYYRDGGNALVLKFSGI